MRYATMHRYALSLPEVTEQPHHHFGSFRVRGKIFVTMPPGQEFIHVFVPEHLREQALAIYPEYLEPLRWGGKVVGLRVNLPTANATVVKRLIKQAWELKAPRALRSD